MSLKKNKMDIVKAMEWRYACKRFDPTKRVSNEKLGAILQATNLTPSSQGLQPCRLVVVEDPTLKTQLFEASHYQKQVVDCSHLLVLCAERISEAFIQTFFERTVELRQLDKTAPHIQRFEKNLYASMHMVPEEQKQWMENQVYLMMGSLLTICAALEVDTCPMEGFNPTEVARILGLDKLELHPVLLCPIGYRHEEDFFQRFAKVRRPLEESVLWY